MPTRRPLGETGVSGPPPGWGTTQVGVNGAITRPSSPGAGVVATGVSGDAGPLPPAVAAWPQPAASRASVRRLVIVFMPL